MRQKLKNLFTNLPNDNAFDFNKKRVYDNFKRGKYLTLTLIFVATIMSIVSFLIEKDDVLIFRFNLVLAIVSFISYLIFQYFEPKNKNSISSFHNIIIMFTSIYPIIWASLMLGFFPYRFVLFFDFILVLLFLPIIFIIKWQFTLLIYGFSWFFLIFATPYISILEGVVYDHIITIFNVMLLNLVISRIIYKNYLENYIIKTQLINHQENLKQIVNQKTKELLSQKYNRLSELAIVLTKVLEYYDTYTKGHSLNVANYAKQISMAYGLSKDKTDTVYFAGLVHDIGKIRVPKQILNKTTKLTSEEYQEIKKHPTYGYEMLKSSKNLQAIAFIVRCHHEWLNGKGYPDGLSYDQIPIESQILSVADAFDAMTSNRIYKKKRSLAEAKTELIRCSGTQFSKKIVDVFLKLLD